MRAKDFIPKDKPRNFVAKNAKMGGAGAHKDKKKAEKQGDVKHKKEQVPMESALSELSTDKLAQYKKAAGADAKKADADGDYTRGDKRFKGINKATNKQFDNDLKKHGQQGVKEAGSPAQQAAIAINMKKHHKKPKHEDISRRGFLRGIGAAAAGAAGLGAAGKAQAQISGEDTLPDIVAHVKFKVDGKEITKDINLGTTYKSPREAAEALEKFLRSKGIKYFEYDLERVKPAPKDDTYLDKAPYTDTGKDRSRIDAGPAKEIKSKSDYMSKEGMSEVAPPTAKGERMVKHIKKGYAKDGKLTDKERSIAYATAWKAHNKSKD